MSRIRPLWTRPPTSLEFRKALKPQQGSYLSGVVQFLGEDGKHSVCFIRFDPERVIPILGKRLPYGIGPEDPVYLKVLWNGWQYEVRACYLRRDSKDILLWMLADPPTWCCPRQVAKMA